MGFRKPQYDVEEKGLNPLVPHKNLGRDGRLLPLEENKKEEKEDNLNTPVSTGQQNKIEGLEKVETSNTQKGIAETPNLAKKAEKDKLEDLDKQEPVLKELVENPVVPKKEEKKKRVVRKTTVKKSPTKKTTKSTSKKRSPRKSKK